MMLRPSRFFASSESQLSAGGPTGLERLGSADLKHWVAQGSNLHSIGCRAPEGCIDHQRVEEARLKIDSPGVLTYTESTGESIASTTRSQ